MGIPFLIFLVTAALVHGAAAREFPSDFFPPKTASEAKFREAAALEAADRREAKARYRELLRDDRLPFSDAVRAALARLSAPAEAEALWQALLDRAPKSPFADEARRGLVRAALAQGHLADAEAALRRLADEARGDEARAAALGRLLPVLDLEGKAGEIAALARVLWIDYAHRPEARTAGAYLRLEAPQPEALFADAELLKRGQLLLDRGSREEAAATLGALRARLPAESEWGPRAALAHGKALLHLRRYAEAYDALAEARDEPSLAEEARYAQVRCLFGMDRGDEGARDLVRAATAQPRHRRAADYLSQASRVFAGRRMWREARRAENRVLSRYPRSSESREVLWARGWRAWRAGRWNEAADRFWAQAQSAGADLGRAQALYWLGRALARAGDVEASERSLVEVAAEFPLGYYGRLAQVALASDRGDLPLADAREGVRDLPLLGPSPEELAVARPDDLARASQYLRLGQTRAAADVLRAASGPAEARARLQYWAEDFRGALATSGRTWLDWPDDADPGPLDLRALAYPLAYPASVSRAAREAGVHPHIVLSIAHTESHFDPRIHSSAEARGLMQFIPATGRQVARSAGLSRFEVEDLYDPQVALRLGARHLRELLDRYEGDAVLASAAYNAGAAAVERWRREFAGLEAAEFVESIPYKETRRYVKKVLTALDAYGRIDPPGLWPATDAPL